MKQTVFITGAGSGLGHATAVLFARKGWNVIATMRRPEREKELTKFPNVLVTQLDVQKPDTIFGALVHGIRWFEKIDVLINNAGFSLFGVFESFPPEKIKEQFDVNLFGVRNVTRAVLPHFREQGSGLVVNISSRAGVVALPMNSLYCASKFALEGFTEALAYELASQNIGVKLIEPSGGTSGTNFGARMAAEMAQNVAPRSYDDFVAQTNATYARMRDGPMASADDVAQVIYDAAIDGTDRLRYIAGNDCPPFMKARQEMTDEEYVEHMRAHFREARWETEGQRVWD